MTILFSLIQFLLGAWHLLGGTYMASHFELLLNEGALQSVPSFLWIALGAVQIVLSLMLLIALHKKFRKWTRPSALGLAILDLLGIFIYVSYSGFPGLLWGLIPALLLGFLAYRKKYFIL